MANTIYFGANEIDDAKLGASQVDEIYLGATLVWPTAPPVFTTLTQIGNALALAFTPISILSLDATHIAVTKATVPRQVITYAFDGTNWATLGTPYALPAGGTPFATRIKSNDTMAVFDGGAAYSNKLTWNGSIFTLVGTEPASVATQTGQPVIGLTETAMAVIVFSGGGSRLQLWTHNGTSWSTTFPLFVLGSSAAYCGARLADDTVALFDSNTQNLRTYTHTAGTWALVGSALNLPTFTGNPVMASLSPTRVAINDSTADNVSIFDWNGSTWVQSGSGIAFVVPTSQKICGMTSNRFAAFANPASSIAMWELT